MQHPSKIKIVEPLITFVIFAVSIFYLLTALNSGSWTWFLQSATNVRPSRIVLIEHGQQKIIAPGHADFNPLADAVSQSLSKLSNTDLVGIGLSQQTLADYETESVVLELYFDSPVEFNTLARTGNPTQLLIPIEGRHAGGRYVFRGAQGEWWFGAVRMADASSLYTALEQMGITVAVVQPTR